MRCIRKGDNRDADGAILRTIIFWFSSGTDNAAKRVNFRGRDHRQIGGAALSFSGRHLFGSFAANVGKQALTRRRPCAAGFLGGKVAFFE